jgi:hypothetical protein
MEYIDPDDRLKAAATDVQRYYKMLERFRTEFKSAGARKSEESAKHSCVLMLSMMDGMKVLLDDAITNIEQVPEEMLVGFLNESGVKDATKEKAVAELVGMRDSLAGDMSRFEKGIQINRELDKLGKKLGKDKEANDGKNETKR